MSLQPVRLWLKAGRFGRIKKTRSVICSQTPCGEDAAPDMVAVALRLLLDSLGGPATDPWPSFKAFWRSSHVRSETSALFGWAVAALFGPADPREKIWLSALVAAAAAWPLLLLGVIWPRLATFVLGFISVPPWVPVWGIRLAWIILAIIVPFVLGAVMAARSRGVAAPIPGTVRREALHKRRARQSPVQESRVIRLVRGIPMTLGVAASFCIVFVSVPLRRLTAIVRRQVDLDIPLVTDADGYAEVAQQVADTLG